MKSSEINKLKATFFENVEIHFVLFDKDLNIIDVNEATLKCYHLEKDQLVGKHVLEISPDLLEKGIYAKYKEVIRTGEAVIIEDMITSPKFGNQHNRIKAFKVAEGLGVALVNITELKTTIDSLEFFILQSSHDLRSPIANIEGLASLALREDSSTEEIIEYLTIIKDQASRTNAIIQKLVETIRIRNEAIENEKIHFGQIIEEVKKSLAFVDGFSNIQFTQNVLSDQDFYSDKSSLISLFQNLIDNAIKYRHNKSEVKTIKILVADGVQGIKITISDNGIGIPENLQKNVFKMFFRATGRQDSIGLGLYSIYQIVKKLGGHITFNSKEGDGTTFSIFLPVVAQEHVMANLSKSE